MKITKMHGLGNDFIIADNRNGEIKNPNETAKKLCERRLSVGADGLITVENSSKADIMMRIYNADGSEAEMCGNGIRCFSMYVYDKSIVKKKSFTVETLAGIMKPVLVLKEGRVEGITVDMGEPCFSAKDIPVNAENPLTHEISVMGKKITAHTCLMGVPHTVIIVDGKNVTDEDFSALGPQIEKNEAYPKKVNVNFVKIIDKNTVSVRTWERGAGPTLACGTGSCATVVLLNKLNLVEPKCEVKLYAGSLNIEYKDRVYMTGPAQYVFTGQCDEA